ncbi:MAG: hypothetical protein ACK5KT_15635 [Dysgonomonas sp.]
MNRTIKVILKILGILVLILMALIIGVLIWFNVSLRNMKKQAEIDHASQTIICDSIQIITDQPSVSMYDFNKEDISELRFSIVRNGAIVTDTLIHNRSQSPNIPFTNFIKTDTILLKTQNNLCYFISGYKYEVFLGYGMFGYVGFKDCRLSNAIIVNGQQQSYSSLDPKNGIRYSDLPEQFK